MPAAAGAAALVPWNGAKSGHGLVVTPSGAASSGFCRTSGAASGVPFASKKCVTGPRELKASGVAGVWQSDAATVSAPLAEAASGLIVPASAGCSIDQRRPVGVAPCTS